MNDRKIAIIVFAIVFLLAFSMRYKAYGETMEHPSPVEITSADANGRVSETEYFALTHQDKYLPAWFDDTYTNVLEMEPPLSGTLAAMVSQWTGLPGYDALYFVALLSGIGVAIIVFVIFWKIIHAPFVGAVAALLLMYPFEWFYHYQIAIGMYPHFTQMVFLILMLLFFLRFLQAKTWLNACGISIMFAFAFLSHAPNAMFILFFIDLALVIKMLKGTVQFKHLLGINALSAILVLPYFPLLFGNYFTLLVQYAGSQGTFQFNHLFTNLAASHPIQIGNFLSPLLYALCIIGIIGSLLFLKGEKNEPARMLVWAFIFFFALTMFSAYLGISHPHVQEKPRHIIYIFAYPVCALGIYIIILAFKDKLPFDHRLLLAAVAIIILALQINAFFALPASGPAISNQESYNAYLWARANVPEKDRILCIGCFQFEGLYTHHPVYLPSYEVNKDTVNQLIDIVTNNNTNGVVLVTSMGHEDNRIYYDGWKMAAHGAKPDVNLSICTFDYWILKDVSQQLFNAIGAKMLARNNTLVYNQQNMAIIRNDNLGKVCI